MPHADPDPAPVPPGAGPSPAGPGRRRLLVAAVLAVLLAVALPLVPVPAYVVQPGPAIGLAELVAVPGGEAIDGDFLFTTVALTDATLVQALVAGVRADQRVASRAAVLGTESEEAFLAHQMAAFEEAERRAVGLGLAAVGSDVDPASVEVGGAGVGGPSAGLLVALAVADAASPQDLAGGRTIAGTGALDEEGAVVAVGGVADKVRAAASAGADVFVVPAEQAAQAEAAADGIRVVAAASLEEAIRALGAGGG